MKTKLKSAGFKRPSYHFEFVSQGSFSRITEPELGFVPDFPQQSYLTPHNIFATLAGRPLEAVEADFLHFCFALYLADRFAPRRPFGPIGATFWRRKMFVRLAVRQPGLWNTLAADLGQMLLFLTGDDWYFDFVPRKYSWSSEEQEHFPDVQKTRPAVVALFSGGLDGLAGLLSCLPEPGNRVLLVSGNTHNRLSATQSDLVEAMRKQFATEFTHVSFRYGMEEIVEHRGMESSQRCRGLVHVGAGLAAATLVGVEKLHLFENGIGALNLPCDEAQFGSQNSRSAHPIFLHRFSRIATQLLGQTVSAENPALMMTKGEMVRALDLPSVGSLLKRSFSCEFFPNYHSRERQCGVCPSCLVRRSALAAAGLPASLETYSVEERDPRRLPERKRLGFSKLNRFVLRLSEGLDSQDSWSGLTRRFPELIEWIPEISEDTKVTEQLLREQILGLFVEFRHEWQMFSSHKSPQPPPTAASKSHA